MRVQARNIELVLVVCAGANWPTACRRTCHANAERHPNGVIELETRSGWALLADRDNRYRLLGLNDYLVCGLHYAVTSISRSTFPFSTFTASAGFVGMTKRSYFPNWKFMALVLVAEM